jgi:hypothetical protein
MNIILQKILDVTKSNWGTILVTASLTSLCAFVYLRSVSAATDFSAQLNRLQSAHDVEISKIVAAQKEERVQHGINLKNLQDDLSNIQSLYEEAKRELDDKKKQKVEQLVKKYGDDPTGMAQQLSDVTGFQIVMP